MVRRSYNVKKQSIGLEGWSIKVWRTSEDTNSRLSDSKLRRLLLLRLSWRSRFYRRCRRRSGHSRRCGFRDRSSLTRRCSWCFFAERFPVQPLLGPRDGLLDGACLELGLVMQLMFRGLAEKDVCQGINSEEIRTAGGTVLTLYGVKVLSFAVVLSNMAFETLKDAMSSASPCKTSSFEI